MYLVHQCRLCSSGKRGTCVCVACITQEGWGLCASAGCAAQAVEIVCVSASSAAHTGKVLCISAGSVVKVKKGASVSLLVVQLRQEKICV